MKRHTGVIEVGTLGFRVDRLELAHPEEAAKGKPLPGDDYVLRTGHQDVVAQPDHDQHGKRVKVARLTIR